MHISCLNKRQASELVRYFRTEELAYAATFRNRRQHYSSVISAHLEIQVTALSSRCDGRLYEAPWGLCEIMIHKWPIRPIILSDCCRWELEVDRIARGRCSLATIVQTILYSFLSIHLDRADQEIDKSTVWNIEESRELYLADYHKTCATISQTWQKEGNTISAAKQSHRDPVWWTLPLVLPDVLQSRLLCPSGFILSIHVVKQFEVGLGLWLFHEQGYH